MMDSAIKLSLCYPAQARPNLSIVSHPARMHTWAERGNSSVPNNFSRTCSNHSSVALGRLSDPSLYRKSCKLGRRPQFSAPNSFLYSWVVADAERIASPILQRFCGILAGARSDDGSCLFWLKLPAQETSNATRSSRLGLSQRQMCHRSYYMVFRTPESTLQPLDSVTVDALRRHVHQSAASPCFFASSIVFELIAADVQQVWPFVKYRQGASLSCCSTLYLNPSCLDFYYLHGCGDL